MCKEIPKEVVAHITAYFSDNLPKYSVMEVLPASAYTEDSRFYMVIAKRKKSPMNKFFGEYACWTSWNELTKSLNFGHYDLPSIQAAREICQEFFAKQC